jgi:pSer/pThr/pTyr-binding forkhead associated (FHA) protein
LLWSGHIQLEDEESQNHIDFNIEKNDTVVRFYAESSEISMNLEEVSSSNGRFIAGGSGSGMI